MQILQLQSSRKNLIARLVSIIEELNRLLQRKDQRIQELEGFIDKINELTYSRTTLQYGTEQSFPDIKLQGNSAFQIPSPPKFKQLSDTLSHSLKQSYLARQLRLASVTRPIIIEQQDIISSQLTQQVEIDVINQLEQSIQSKPGRVQPTSSHYYRKYL